jgi:SAM-dependent methyltransferase
MPKTEWWSDFFSGLALDLWREAMSKEHTGAEVAFIQSRLRLASGARILDVPCGLGRLSLEIAELGFEVTGVDFSPACLHEARAGALSRELKIIWEQRDMRDLPWPEKFDGAFCFGNSFGYLDDEGNAKFLKSVYGVLKRGARFVMDAPSVAENILPRIQDRSETQIGDVLFIEENRYDHVLGRLDTDYTFRRGNQIERKFGSHRLYTYRQIHEMLRVAGFVNCEAFGSTEGEPFCYGAPGLLFVAEKEK